MDAFTWIAAACYFLAVILGLIFGLMYLFSPRVFRYHEWVMGKKWDELDSKMKTLLLALMRGIGGAMLALAAALASMIVYAFIPGEAWSRWAIPVVGLIAFGGWLYSMVMDKERTKARTPVLVPLVGIGLMIAGFILSFL
jgi:uncharacterized membrane protein